LLLKFACYVNQFRNATAATAPNFSHGLFPRHRRDYLGVALGFMWEMRLITNLIGNGAAAVVVSKMGE